MRKFVVLAFLVLGIVLGTLAQGKVTITVAVYPDLDSVIKAILPAFNALYPDIAVKLEVAGYGDHHTKLLTALAAGKGVPDVAAVEIGYIAKFASEGGLVDLSQPPYNGEAYRDLFVPYAWQQAHTTDGRLIGMPADIAPATMFWRRDVFAERGVSIDEIKTWEDYIEVGKKLTYDADGDGEIDHWLVDDAATVAMILWGGHTHFFDENGNCIVDSERFVKAFTVAKRIRDAGLDARIPAWTNEWYEAFRRGTVATAVNGAWLLGHLKNWIAPKTAGLWGAAQLPEGTFTQRGGTWYVIPQASEHKDAAWKLVKFLTTNPDVQLRAFEITNAFPAVQAVWEAPIFEEPVPFLGGQPARLLWKEAVQRIVGVPTNPNDAIAMEIVSDALTQVLEEGRPIKEALAEAKQLIERRTRL
jgi:multiple sugar transport system substrate-binding protein